MIKARNRKISMLLVLAMLMTMFVGVGTASAAATISVLSAPTVEADGGVYDLGTVKVKLQDVEALPDGGAWLTISLPSGSTFAAGVGTEFEVDGTDGISATNNIALSQAKIIASDTLEFLVAEDLDDGEDIDGSITIKFLDIKVKTGSGDIVANFLSNDSSIGSDTAVIGRIGSGATVVSAKSVKNIGDIGDDMNTLTIAETIPGVFDENEVIKLQLPKGFYWDEPGIAQGGWGLSGATFDAWRDMDNKRILYVELDEGIFPTTEAGRVDIGITGAFFSIGVEDNAKFGDVNVTVSSSEDSVEKQDVLVAKYGDYGVEVIEDTKKDVDSGRANQELGQFIIKENLPESLDADRTIYLELPKGVKWATDESDEPIISLKSESGSTVELFKEDCTLSNGDRKLKLAVQFEGTEDARFSDSAAKFRVKGMEVNVEPSFEGDIAITVSGKAGVEGEAIVGTAARPVTVKAENPTKVEIGAMNQAAGDILIIENKDEAILDEEYNEIIITLPEGVTFYEDPTVEVEEGDLEIDDVEIYDDAIIISIDSASSKQSTIRVSDVFLTVDRTVPEGDVVAVFAGHEVKNDQVVACGSCALVNWATEESYGKVVIATTITPSQGGHAKFVIGSNIYEIGGIPYVMDTVPYIKDSRSYVPMAYLAKMLGAEVKWSAADQTVTLTKEGETEVVFTIGSTSYTVNGEVMTADVAPEIVVDRSFLPARYAAEAFGAHVGWDAATQTVIIIR